MFKVNNKDIRTTSLTSFWCFSFIWTYFTPFSCVSILDFERLIVCRETILFECSPLFQYDPVFNSIFLDREYNAAAIVFFSTIKIAYSTLAIMNSIEIIRSKITVTRFQISG